MHKEDEEPDAKKQKPTPESFTFAKDILEKVPDNAQTIRSLLQFLEKKLQGETPAAPEVGGPKELRSCLEAHADKVGRLSALRATSGWDARAKRVLDVVAAVKTAAGGAVLEAAEKGLEKAKPELEKQLKEKNESGLDASVEKRVAWAKDSLKREWLLWCSRLLRAREAALAKDGAKEPATAGKAPSLTFVAIIEALLSGEGGLSRSNAGG